MPGRFRYSHLKEAAAFAADAVPTMGIDSEAPENARLESVRFGLRAGLGGLLRRQKPESDGVRHL